MFFSWFHQTSSSTSRTLVIDLRTMRTTSPMTQFFTTFITTQMPVFLENKNKNKKNNVNNDCHQNYKKNSLITTTTTTTTTTSDIHDYVTNNMNYYIKIFQIFINEFTKKQKRDFYMILIFIFVFLCISIIIIVILIKIIRYYSTIHSFTGQFSLSLFNWIFY